MPGRTKAIVLGTSAGTASILNTRTHRAGKPITVGASPDAIAITR